MTRGKNQKIYRQVIAFVLALLFTIGNLPICGQASAQAQDSTDGQLNNSQLVSNTEDSQKIDDDSIVSTYAYDYTKYTGKQGEWIGNPGWRVSGSSNIRLQAGNSQYGAELVGGTVRDWISMEIRVPTAGTYRAITQNWINHWGKKVEIFISPSGVRDPQDPIYRIAQYDNFDYPHHTDKYEQTELGIVTLTPGTYTIVYRLLDHNTRGDGTLFTISGFYLKPLKDGQRNLNIAGVLDPIICDKSVSTELYAYLGNRRVNLTEDIKVTCRDPKIADAKIDIANDKKMITINGISPGITEITLETKIDGQPVTCKIPVTVVKPETLDKISILCEKTTLKTGEESKLTINALAMDGSKPNLSGGVIYYKSTNAAVAAVDALGKITAKQAGSAVITGYLELDGVIRSANVSITVTDDTQTVSVDWDNETVMDVGSALQLKVIGKRSSGNPISFPTTNIKYTLVSCEPAGAATLSQTGVLSAILAGTATVKASVTVNENTLETAPLTLKILPISGRDQVIDFRKTQTGKPIDATIKSHGWQINRDKTANPESVVYHKSGLQTRLLNTDKPTDADLTLDVSVQGSGYYTPKFSGGKYLGEQYDIGCETAVYFDETYIGSYSFKGKEMEQGECKVFNSLYLESGIHTITFRRTNMFGGSRAYPGVLSLESINKFPDFNKLTVHMNKDQIIVNESDNVTVSAVMSNDEMLCFGKSYQGEIDLNNNLKITNKTPNIIQIKDGVVWGITPGVGIIDVDATVQGEVHHASCQITVENGTLSSMEASLSKPNLFASAESDVIMTAKTDNGRILDNTSLQVDVKSSNENIVTVDGSHVHAKAEGTASLEITASMKGAPIEINESAIVTAVSSDESIATVRVDNQDGKKVLLVNGHKPGMASIKVNIKQGDKSGNLTIDVDVIGTGIDQKAYTYNFKQAFEKNKWTGSLSTLENMPWAWTNVSNGRNKKLTRNEGYLFFGNSDARFQTDGTPEWFVIDIDVPEDGTYDSSISCNHRSYSGEFDIYIAPQNVGYTTDSKYKVGYVNASSGKGTVKTELGQVKLTAGKYSVTFAARKWSGYWIYLGSLMLTKQKERPVLSSNADMLMEILENKQMTVPLEVSLGQLVIRHTLDVTVAPIGLAAVELSADASMIKPDSEGCKLTVTGKNGKDEKIDLTRAEVVYTSKNPEIAIVSENGVVLPVALGDAVIEVNVTQNGVTCKDEITITVTEGKTEPTYYTNKMRQIAQENIQKYPWAKSQQDAAIKEAEKYLNLDELLWKSVTAQSIMRNYTVGSWMYDKNSYKCRYCGEDLRAKYGNYPWIVDALKDPWKVKCPECRRKFPSNDFGSYYELGCSENGTFDPELAKRKNDELIAQGKPGYLVNTLYPEKGAGWGVDDGTGYATDEYVTGSADGPQQVRHTYIAYYNYWGLWSGMLSQALNALSEAYLLTGDIKYGRTGAILLDRIADVLPDMDIGAYEFHKNRYGRIIDQIWDCGFFGNFARSYDIFYPAYEDPQVLEFLSKKAEMYHLENPKNTPKLLRQNCEDNILRAIYTGCKTYDLEGNFGHDQRVLITAAVILDNFPETREWIDFAYQNRKYIYNDKGRLIGSTGGDIMRMINQVYDRDGMGAEASIGYGYIGVDSMLDLTEPLLNYKGYNGACLLDNPKFIKMILSTLPLMLCSDRSPEIGDSGAPGKATYAFADQKLLIKAYQYTRNYKFAQMIYKRNGNTAEGLCGDIFTQNPMQIEEDVRQVIKEYGEYGFSKSTQMSGFGFSALRGGVKIPSVGSNGIYDTQRDFWMYYGNTSPSHGHPCVMNLGIEAYGVNMAPEQGYPEATWGDSYYNWSRTSINHNLVIVNDKNQDKTNKVGNPLHFDDAGRVKIMDADSPSVYSATSIYRRTVVMVDASDDVSYGVDFFRVKGGNEHLYSFHSMSDELYDISDLGFIKQSMGSYAGPDVPWRATGYTNGYSYIKNVRKAQEPGTGEFFVDFKVKDFQKMLSKEQDLHLRMTMLNDFDLNEITLASAEPPRTASNTHIPWFEYVLARRSGNNLDSLFTTIYEPYKEERYIKDMKNVPITRIGGENPGTNDAAKAVKVTLVNGREDYIVYATNNRVKYRVDDAFDFSGFVGVYTLVNGKCAYSYLNDGEIIGDRIGTAEYTGEVLDFTKEPAYENTMKVRFDSEVDTEKLVGRQIYVNHGGASTNGVYPINSVKMLNNRTAELGLGDITLISGYVDPKNIQAGYTYNIKEGQSFKIPLPTLYDPSPIFKPVPKQHAEVGSELKVIVSAESPSGRPLVYSANTLPRGAQFDPESRTLTWTPDKGLLGENHVSIDASDGVLTSTVHFPITVFGSTKGPGKNEKIQDHNSNNQNNQQNQNNNQNNQNPEIKQSVEVKADAKLVSGIAAVEPKKDDVIKGINGAEKVIVNVSEVKDAKSYSVKLPVDVVTNHSLNRNVEVKTPAGNIMLPTEMLANDASMVTSKDAKVAVTLTKTDKTLKVDLAVNGKEYNWSNINVPVKIESTYKPSEEMKNTTCIIIKDAQGNIIPSGKYENGNITVYATKLGGEYSVSYNEKSFNDLEKHNWASEAITGLAARGIINGTSESTYSPANNITRADFITLVVRALGLKAESADNFSDVNANDYFAKEVGIAKSLGIVTGQGGNKVNPKSQISREDMMVIVARALPKAGYKLEKDSAGKFSDAASIAEYATDSVNTLVSSKIVAGSNGKINPKGKTTRAEVAVLLSRIIMER